MNKIKLEVVRINEDVIATSGKVAANSKKIHILITSIDTKVNYYYYDIDQTTPFASRINNDDVSSFEYMYFNNPETGWYYKENSVWNKCSDDHSEYQQ